jgi:hypothetical protein
LLLSVLKSSQAPLHAVVPVAVHVKPHVEPLHVAVPPVGAPVHLSPHPLQLAGSLVVSTQAPEQFVNPLLHEIPHTLLTHVGCPWFVDGHAFPHVAQSAGLEVVSTHVPLHSLGVPTGQPVTQP